MAYNETLAQRVRDALISQPQVEEKKMMGGLVFMVNDKMCLGIALVIALGSYPKRAHKI